MKRRLLRPARHRSSHSGFTLLELLLVLVIIAAIAGIAVFNFSGIQDSAYKKTAAGQINALEGMLDMYRLNLGTFPTTLESLYEQPSDVDANKWTQISKDAIEPDPWGNALEYKLSGSEYEIRCLGPDGKSGTEDDITS